MCDAAVDVTVIGLDSRNRALPDLRGGAVFGT